MITTVYIATDHAGFALKEEIATYIASLGYDVIDLGATTYDALDDYPDFILPCAHKVRDTPGSKGIILGGSGQGEAMAANKVEGIRAAVFYGEAYFSHNSLVEDEEDTNGFSMIALVREHNNANILSLGARFLSLPVAREAIQIFLETDFKGDARHVRRIQKY